MHLGQRPEGPVAHRLRQGPEPGGLAAVKPQAGLLPYSLRIINTTSTSTSCNVWLLSVMTDIRNSLRTGEATQSSAA